MNDVGVAICLEHARVVHDDCIATQSLFFANGRVAASARSVIHVDLRDHLVFPGLINAHDHLQLNSIPPLRHAAPFRNSYEWIAAFDAHFGDPEVATAVAVPVDVRHWNGALKNVLAGVTTVAHHDPWRAVLDDAAFPVGLLRRFGWCHSLGLGLGEAGAAPSYGPAVRASFVDTPSDAPWIIHLAEGTDDVAARELSQLEAMGCLATNTVLVHGTGLTSDDVLRVIASGAAVVWCPSSNVGMFGRTLDPRVLHDAGRLSLGSDSRLTGARDLLGELAFAGQVSDLSSRELLRLVTGHASRALRMPLCGGLAIGQQADCVIVRDSGDAYASLVGIERSTIRAVVRGGVPVVADPDFAEWFAACGVETLPAKLDGVPKLIAASVARPEAIVMEIGLER